MHRHLLGLDDLPEDFGPYSLTTGFALPAYWDGDAWFRVNKKVDFFLLAWNTRTGCIAYGSGSSEKEARAALANVINDGGIPAVITPA